MGILVTGVAGQLGYELCLKLDAAGIACKGVDIADFDLIDRAAVRQALDAYNPGTVVHCAAYTNVNKAETDRALCFAVNEIGTRNLAEWCGEHSRKLIYISTDYVFPGNGELPFETEDPKGPLNVYGESKLAGEEAVKALCENYAIVRTSWVYGLHGSNFVKTMAALGAERESVRVVCDQIGSPTYAPDLAALLAEMLEKDVRGVFHGTNEGYCSWSEFAAAIMTVFRRNCRVEPIPTSDYPSPAVRPLNSRLSKASLDIASLRRLPHWRDALRRYAEETCASTL